MPTHFPRCVSPLNKKPLIYSAVKVMYAHNADRNILCDCRERKKVVDCEESVCVFFKCMCIRRELDRGHSVRRWALQAQTERKMGGKSALRFFVVILHLFCRRLIKLTTRTIASNGRLWGDGSASKLFEANRMNGRIQLGKTRWAAKTGFSVLEIVKRHSDVGQSVGFEPDNAGTMRARLVSDSLAWWK